MDLSLLHKEIGIGEVKKNCEFNVFDKVDNLSSEKSIIFINNEKYIKYIDNPLISGIICTNDIYKKMGSNNNIGIWVSENPKDLFYQCHQFLVTNEFYNKPFNNEISPNAKISSKAIIARHSVAIGSGCIIEDNVIIKSFTKIGRNSIIRSNSDIGSDGFEATRIAGILKIVKHGGEVIIGDNVEIQSLVTISRGLFPTRNTIISDNVKIADMVHIAHGVQIAKNCLIAAGVTISGNVTIEEGVWIGPGAILSNRIVIGKRADITIGSVVARNVKSACKVTGNLAIDHNDFLDFIIKNKLI
jgi:UDP-3-O-[3-hydroxymyristoyl] glucosamine N-acyltransferase